MKLQILILLFFVTFFQINSPLEARLRGQDQIDSLVSELPNVSDSSKVALLVKISFAYNRINPVKGIEYGEIALEISQEIDWLNGISLSYGSIGSNYWVKSDLQKALSYYEKKLEIVLELGKELSIAKTYGNIGSIHQNMSNYPKALEYSFKSLEIKEKLGNKSGIANSLNSIGVIYNIQDEYDKALEYFQKSLKVKEELNDKPAIAGILSNIGAVYHIKNDYDKALETYLRSLEINEEIGNNRGTARTLNFIGVLYNYKSDYINSYRYHQRALELYSNLGNLIGIAASHNHLGQILFDLSQDGIEINPKTTNEFISSNKKRNLKNAIINFNKSLEVYEEAGIVSDRSDLYLDLADAYRFNNEPIKEAKSLRQHLILKDSVFNQDKAKEIGKLEAEREQLEKEYDQKEQARIEKEKISRRNQIQYSAISIVTILVFAFIFYLTRKNVSFGAIDTLTFVAFLLLYEFILVITEPWVDEWTNEIPVYKLLFNIALAIVLIPLQKIENRIKDKSKK